MSVARCMTIALLLTVLASMPAAAAPPKVIHVFVILCDNTHQQIVPVPAHLGDGEAPETNLYWGARYGVKQFFKNSPHWELLNVTPHPAPPPQPRRWEWLPVKKDAPDSVLERIVFRHTRHADTYLVADAYRGRRIKEGITEFLKAAAGAAKQTLMLETGGLIQPLPIHGGAEMVVYVGHNGLMDFQLPRYPEKQDDRRRDAIVLACRSKAYFETPIRRTGAYPLLWTNGLMAPEAYTLEAALEGWIELETPTQIRTRAAEAYHRYQKCGLQAAMRLFSTGFE